MLKNIFHQIYALLYFLPGFGQEIHPQIIGRLDDQLAECSGMAELPSGNLAMINDSGNPPEVFITDSKGQILKTITIDFAENRDWEELVYAKGFLYIGDFGNNANKREDLKIYRVGVGENDSLYNAGKITINYTRQERFPPPAATQNYDMEAMVYSKDSLFLFSKNRTEPFTGYTYQYGFPAKPGHYDLVPQDSFKTGHGAMHLFWVAGAALHRESSQLALLGYDKLWLFYDFPNNHFFRGKNKTFHFKDVSQREALLFADRSSILLTDEQNVFGGGNLYKLKLPETDTATAAEVKVSVVTKEIQDTLVLDFEGATEENIYWEIFNTAGARVLFGTIKGLRGEKRHYIETTSLQNGGFVLNVIIHDRPHAYLFKKPIEVE